MFFSQILQKLLGYTRVSRHNFMNTLTLTSVNQETQYILLFFSI